MFIFESLEWWLCNPYAVTEQGVRQSPLLLPPARTTFLIGKIYIFLL